MKRQLLFISLFVLFQVLAFIASGQRPDDRGMAPLPNSISIKKALVIGNANYTYTKVLRNPVNDANAMSDTLIKLGFKVSKHLNVRKEIMEEVINNWGKELQKDDIALFFFAGHGMEVSGQNYLFPIDANPQNESQIKHHTLNVELITGWMKESATLTNIILLDACRNNPFTNTWRSANSQGGLGTMTAPSGTFIGFAASPGEIASDGDGNNGLYTEAILNYITKPNLTIDQVFNYVNGYVEEKSKSTTTLKKQIPFRSSSLKGDFYFISQKPNKPVIDNSVIRDTIITSYKPHPLALKLSVAAIGIISGIIANSIKSNFDSKVDLFNTLDRTLPVNGFFNSQSDLDKWNSAYSEAQKAQKTGLLNAMLATSILSLGYELFLLTTKVKVQTRKTILAPSISSTSLGFVFTHKF